ncbi:MAG: hypothetical protein SF097_08565 [Acidobacteriota bacterium]|nr:hypothetical protein [Acidobacteriota bacterium]
MKQFIRSGLLFGTQAQPKKAPRYRKLTLNQKTRLRKGDLCPEIEIQGTGIILTMKNNGGNFAGICNGACVSASATIAQY